MEEKELTLQERADNYAGHAYELGEDPAVTMERDAYSMGALDQMKIDAGAMRKLNEEWERNLDAQRAELIDKAYGWWSKVYLQGEPDCYHQFKKAMEG